MMDEEKNEQLEPVPAEASEPVPAEAPEQDAEKKPGMNAQTRYLIRILVGGYLAYLGWQLVKSYIDGSASSKAVAIIGGAAFLLLGIGLVVWSVVLMTRDDT